jgi:hypothetical protein
MAIGNIFGNPFSAILGAGTGIIGSLLNYGARGNAARSQRRRADIRRGDLESLAEDFRINRIAPENFLENYGEQGYQTALGGLQTRIAQDELTNRMFGRQAENVQMGRDEALLRSRRNAAAQMQRNLGSARGINLLRALNMSTNLQASEADRNITRDYLSGLNTIEDKRIAQRAQSQRDLSGMTMNLAQMRNRMDLTRAQGAQMKNQALRADQASFFNMRGKAIQDYHDDMSKAQAIGIGARSGLGRDLMGTATSVFNYGAQRQADMNTLNYMLLINALRNPNTGNLANQYNASNLAQSNR